eukprot:Skav236847  [mRNA]  locus=scaffold1027:253413:258249:+ [translate_table: standard]
MSKHRPELPCLVGAWRRPPNDLQEQEVGGGHKAIHDDATAAKVGLKLAPIHGTVHWSQLTPLLLEAFGPAWFETGSISVHFVNMVGHLQPVRAFLEISDKNQRKVWMEHMDGRAPQLLFTRHASGTETLDLEDARIDFDQANSGLGLVGRRSGW